MIVFTFSEMSLFLIDHIIFTLFLYSELPEIYTYIEHVYEYIPF